MFISYRAEASRDLCQTCIMQFIKTPLRARLISPFRFLCVSRLVTLFMPLFCLKNSKESGWLPVHIFPFLFFAIGFITSTNWQRGARIVDKLSRILITFVCLTGVWTSLPATLCKRKVNPTICNTFFLIAYRQSVLLTECSWLANQYWRL